jgi:hypothetical protein
MAPVFRIGAVAASVYIVLVSFEEGVGLTIYQRI